MYTRCSSPVRLFGVVLRRYVHSTRATCRRAIRRSPSVARAERRRQTQTAAACQRNVSERRKKEVAYAQNYRCKSCNVLLPPNYEIDHIMPIALGGHNGFKNLQALCTTCHRLKTQEDMQRIAALRRDSASSNVEESRHNGTEATAGRDNVLDSGCLNLEQRKAVMCDQHKSVRVVAGPGTGKTAVLTQRIAALVNNFGVSPRNICALTFTNRAAHEMRERIAGLLSPEDAEQVTLGTFHSVCLSILRSNIDLVQLSPPLRVGREVDDADGVVERPYRRGFGVYDDTDSLNVIRSIVRRDLGWTSSEVYPSPSYFQAAISAAKNKGMVDARAYLQRGEDSGDPRVATVFALYERALRRRNMIDFDDMLWLTSAVLSQQPRVLSKYRRRWSNILCDEYQDTNVPQFEIIHLLGSAFGDDDESTPVVFAVGDPHQAIYSFRGSQSSTLARLFDETFDPVSIFRLTENYRSTQPILDAAHRLICHNNKDSSRDGGGTTSLISIGSESEVGHSFVSVNSFEHERDEARFIAETCLRSHLVGGDARDNDIAVLMRTNAQFRCIERELIRHKVNHVIVNGTRFFDRREVRDVVSFVKTVVRPTDCLALERIVNIPPRQIGQKTLLRLRNAASGACSMWDVISSELDRVAATSDADDAGNDGDDGLLPNRSIAKFASFHRLIAEARRDIFCIETERSPPADVMLSDAIVELLRRVGYDTWCRHELSGGDERWSNVRELVNSAATTRIEDVSNWLDEVALLSDPATWSPTDKKSPSGNVDNESGMPPVRLMTIHAAKGSEFSTVFVAGCEEELLPHYHALHATSLADTADAIEEERRCCYVALTRAKRRAFLTCARERMSWGRSNTMRPSRFLGELGGGWGSERVQWQRHEEYLNVSE